jgi:chloramphenicol-sensitive protein RarD
VRESSKGIAAAAAAFTAWGVFPLYFEPLLTVSSVQVIAHRIVWSCLVVFGWMALRGELRDVWAALADRRVVWRLALSATLMAT